MVPSLNSEAEFSDGTPLNSKKPRENGDSIQMVPPIKRYSNKMNVEKCLEIEYSQKLIVALFREKPPSLIGWDVFCF